MENKHIYIFTIMLGIAAYVAAMEPPPPPIVFDQVQPQRPAQLKPMAMQDAFGPLPAEPQRQAADQRAQGAEEIDLVNAFVDMGRDLSRWLWQRWVATPARRTVGAAGDEIVRSAIAAVVAESGENGGVHRFITNFLQGNAQQFAPNGAGTLLVRNIVDRITITLCDTLSHHMSAAAQGAEGQQEVSRAIRNLLRTTLNMLVDEINHFEQVIQAMANMWERLIRQEGPIGRLAQRIDATVRREIIVLTQLLETSVNQLGKNVKEQVDAIGKNIEERYDEMKWSGVRAMGVGAAVVATSWFGSRVIWQKLERYFDRPRLVSNSSRKTITQQINDYFWPKPLVFREMIFAKDLKKELDDIVAITKHVSQEVQKGATNVSYLNILLWGPPGTGKTMFAEELAKKTGKDFAIIPASAFSKFTAREGNEAIDELFEWAEKSKKGLIIVIDEAEAFLSREKTIIDANGHQQKIVDPTSKEYQFLTNFLHKTSEASKKSMCVYTTNRPQLLDNAIRNRIHREIYVGLPEKPERIKILRYYRDLLLLDKDQNSFEFMETAQLFLADDIIDGLAQKLKGFAPRELKDIIADIKVSSDISQNHVVSKEVVDFVVDRAFKKHNLPTAGYTMIAPAA